MFKVEKDQLTDPFVKNWYIRVKDKETGPYSYTEVCILIENEDVSSDESITLLGHGSWHKMSESPLFTKMASQLFLKEQNIDLSTDIPLRKSIRVPLTAEIAVVCDGRMFKAATCDMSTSGMMIKINRHSLRVGSIIKIHLYSAVEQKLKSLNFFASVVRKINKPEPVSKHDKEAMSPIQKFDHFGIEFSDMDEKGKDHVKELIRQSIMEGHKSVSVDEIFGVRIKGLDYGPDHKIA
jgi:hypothetical protein